MPSIIVELLKSYIVVEFSKSEIVVELFPKSAMVVPELGQVVDVRYLA